MLAVDSCYRKNGIAAVLIETSLELARSKGYRKAVVEATGEFSYKSILKFGFKATNEVMYKDFITRDGNRPWENLSGPHTHIRMLELDLSSLSDKDEA